MKFKLPEPIIPTEYVSPYTWGHYFVFGIHVENIFRVWKNIRTSEILDVLNDHAIYISHYHTWWVKIGALRNRANAPNQLAEETPDPVGGTQSRYIADYYAHCKDGEVIRELKDRHYREMSLHELYDGDPVIHAALKARVMKKMGDREPYGIPPDIHLAKYGVLYPRMGIGRHWEEACIDVLDYR